MLMNRDIWVGDGVRVFLVPKYAMLTISISANSSFLSMLHSRTTLLSKPPNIIVVPAVTLGPSGPHLFLDFQLAKRAWIGKDRDEWVRMMY